MIEHIHALQQELMETRIREADHESIIRDLKNRIHELETVNFLSLLLVGYYFCFFF